MQNEFIAVWNFVIKNGTLVHRAKSAWGSDRWKCDELIATLEDDGATKAIISHKIKVRENYAGKLIFSFGSEEDLKELFDSIKVRS
jgi:hypothetical protein